MNNQTFDEHTEIYHCCRWCRHYIDSMERCVLIEDSISFINDGEAGYFTILNPDTFYCKYFD